MACAMRSRHALTRTAIAAALVAALGFLPALVATGEADRTDRRAAAIPAFTTPAVAPAAARQAVRPPTAGPRPADVKVTFTRPGHVLPRSFLGLSFEYWDLPRLDATPRLLTRVFDLLHVRGNGPAVLRIGGDSADHSYWHEVAHPSTFPSFHVNAAYLGLLRGLTLRAHLRLLLDLNLAARDPGMAGAFTRIALARLPRGSVQSFEVGNEPDIYHREPFYRLAAVADVRIGSPAAWDRYNAARYTSEFTAYSRAVSSVSGGVPLSGPEVANPRLDLSWLQAMLAADRPTLGMLTAHRYPLSACAPRSSRLYPTIGRILNPRATVSEARSTWPAIRLARQAGLPFRITEMNSVTCGGVRGVSNTFATALWAPDALFALLRAGVAGVNIHVRPSKVNAAFAIENGRLAARPLLYGLLAFVRTLNGHPQMVGTRVATSRRVNVAVWATRNRAGAINVLALDKGSRAVRLWVDAPPAGPAVVQRLTAPGVRATSGVTLAGQTVSPAGTLTGRVRTERITAGGSGYRVTLPPYSGAIVSLPGRGFPRVVQLDHPRGTTAATTRRPAPARRSTPRLARRARPATPAAQSARRTWQRARERGRRSRRDRRRSR